MKDSLLIHHDNVVNLDDFDSDIYFDVNDSDVDSYISQTIIPQIKESSSSMLYIKDNLSDNYMELLGLRVAYHIRLSEELEDKRYMPIVIISELDGYHLGKLSDEANILFTKNIFVVKNEKNLPPIDSKPLTLDEYQSSFLNLIHIEQPSEYESHHDIANEWAIYRWAKILGLKSEVIEQNYKHSDSLLYFKYLKALRKKDDDELIYTPKELQYKGKILFIDDEAQKGWGDILKKIYEPSTIEFETLDYDFKDSNKFKIINDLEKVIKEKSPDLVVLDLRFTQSDHENKTDTNQYTGIQIAKKIKEINLGIQTIIMSATSQSLIVQRLYDAGVVGYIKKEHPKDTMIETDKSIEKLLDLSQKALSRKYLKEVWEIQEEILELEVLNDEEFYQIRSEIEFIFTLLDSDIANRYSLAMLTIYKILERIRDHYIDDRSITYKDSGESIKAIYKVAGSYEAIEKNEFIKNYESYGLKNEKYASSYYSSAKNRFLAIFYEKLSLQSDESYRQIEIISKKRNNYIHPKRDGKNPTKIDILEWLKMLKSILGMMNKT
jgi:CheY-like chemotaxis protein